MVKAKKSLGQHFLTDPVVVSEIITALNPAPGETVVEIGSGQGVLTMPLVNSGADVVAVELDRILAPQLAEAFAGRANVRVIEADILSFDPAQLGLTRFALVGNLPYNITTPVMDWLLKYHDAVDRAVMMMQKEVAERVSSPPGKRARSTISVLTELYYSSEIICTVPSHAFRPPPKVDSAVVKFVRHSRVYPLSNMARFEKLVRNCFRSKRKSLLNNLDAAYPIKRAELEEIVVRSCGSSHIRAEQLDLDTFVALANTILSLT
jgi:16S rRNA (adenine1518-N6/adenine1519-N6)-dimethyltransferase